MIPSDAELVALLNETKRDMKLNGLFIEPTVEYQGDPNYVSTHFWQKLTLKDYPNLFHLQAPEAFSRGVRPIKLGYPTILSKLLAPSLEKLQPELIHPKKLAQQKQ